MKVSSGQRRKAGPIIPGLGDRHNEARPGRMRPWYKGTTVPMTSAESPMPWSRTPWKAASSRAIYENRWMKLREDIALLPDGRTTIYGVIERRAFPFSEVLRMVEQGEIKDSMTVIAVLHTARLRDR